MARCKPPVRHPNFFPKENQLSAIKTAKAFCLGCFVRKDCLMEAYRDGEQGIWGGTTEDERALMGAFFTLMDEPKSLPLSGLSYNLHLIQKQEIHIVLDIHISTPEQHQVDSIQPAVLNLQVPQEFHTRPPLELEAVQVGLKFAL